MAAHVFSHQSDGLPCITPARIGDHTQCTRRTKSFRSTMMIMTMAIRLCCVVLFPITVVASGQHQFRSKDGLGIAFHESGGKSLTPFGDSSPRTLKQAAIAQRPRESAGDVLREILELETRPQCGDMSLPALPHRPHETPTISATPSESPSVVESERPSMGPVPATEQPELKLQPPLLPEPVGLPTILPATPPPKAMSDTPSMSPEATGVPVPSKSGEKSKDPSATSAPSRLLAPPVRTRAPVTLSAPVPDSQAPVKKSSVPVSTTAPVVSPPSTAKTKSPSDVLPPIAPTQSPSQTRPSPIDIPPVAVSPIGTSPSPLVPSSAPSKSSSNDSTAMPNTSSRSPNSSPAARADVFGCNAVGSVELVQRPSSRLTLVDFNVRYQVESLAPLDEYVEEMELKILEVAVAGALQCNSRALFNSTGSTTAPNRTRPSNTAINTISIGDSCVEPVTSCAVLVTSFNATLDEDLDPDVAEFLGYVALREAIDGGAFSNEIQAIDRMRYAGPLPLLPPVINDDEVNQQPVQDIQSSDRVSVSPWALGAVSVASAGGLIALIIWLRNRATQNRRHMELVEDMSVGSPSRA